jgi:hypothetical protein
MASLKSFLPRISRSLYVSPEALYERQRSLVRLGVLESKEGRGPGSGVRLSAHSLAILIASIFIADHPSELNENVSRLLSARAHGGRCEVTGASTFGEALSRLLSSPRMHVGSPLEVVVDRAAECATISRRYRGTTLTRFGYGEIDRGVIKLVALRSETLRDLADKLWLADPPPPHELVARQKPEKTE